MLVDSKNGLVIDQAKALLQNNLREGYTIPSGRLYPFQWNWDAGFIALGWWYFDQAQAILEIKRMFEGQWKNGFLPHINFFRPNDNYFPGPDVWKTQGLHNAPADLLTSGITQPPVFGFIVKRMHDSKAVHDTDWVAFLKYIYPKILDFHRYLYEYRDPYKEGLVYIQHNWESGTDNSPIWDDIFERMDVSTARDVSSLRKDNKNVDPSERPTNENYKRYIYLVDLFASLKYADAAIAKESPFLVQDVLFNSLLVKSNEGLIAIGEFLGEDVSIIKVWNEKTKQAIQQKLWNPETGFYYAYDLRLNKPIHIKTSSGFAPLFAGICSNQQAQQMAVHLQDAFAPTSEWLLCASTAADEPAFNPLKYWRGPVWINLNWMLYHGFMRYGMLKLAERISKQTIELVEQHGFFEYFDPRPKATSLPDRGIGADNFSWTAALYLDLMYNNQML